MKLPDRIRLSPYARLTVLKAIRCYVKTLLETPTSERDNWPEAMDAWKLGKSLALRPKGRRELWGVDWFYNFDASRPVNDITEWIKQLEEALRPSDLKPVSQVVSELPSQKIPSVTDSASNL